ncbi:MAG: hypothetical protein ABRQ24_06510 [Syntrophomonadaceae bacterium]
MVDYKESVNKNLDMFNNAADKMWDMWIAGLNSLKWNAEQIENLTRSQLDMSRNARQEFMKQMEDMVKQMRQNQMQAIKMVEDTMMSGYQQIEQAAQSINQEIAKKVEEVTKK